MICRTSFFVVAMIASLAVPPTHFAFGADIVNPHDPDIVLVAALGHAYGPNEERGVFRTADGGRSWTRVLYKDKDTGAADVAFDPGNPNIVYAYLHGELMAELSRWRSIAATDLPALQRLMHDHGVPSLNEATGP